MAKKILFVIAHEGYQPIEYGIPKKIIADAGFTIVTASNTPGTATSKDGSTTKIDITVADAQMSDYDALVFIGGPGALDNLDNEESYELIRQFDHAGKLCSAICVSPRILVHAGILTNVHATGWDGDGQLQKVFDEYEVKFIDAPVVVDQHIITATGPSAAQEFGEEIVRYLKKK